jgi:DNA mismatch repair protein MutL
MSIAEAVMKNKIKILPEGLINQIAAGEVVERPASVVKELIENALDAGALRLVVELEKAGKRLIRVLDDGDGMSRDDALLALERHATSKIWTQQDLFAISSLGFRGEALPSIAAVSRLEVVTRARDMDEAVRVLSEGGVVKDVSETGAPFGTSIQVKSLFYNVPARRKFLKSHDTELGHISDLLSRIALGRPDVHLEAYHDGKTMLIAPGSQKLSERIQNALGSSAADQLLPLEKSPATRLREGPLSIHGYISRPGFNRSTARSLYIFINHRHIKDRVINHAILEAYRTLMPKGRYPVVVLYIDMPAESVDVNVHPAKSEVRFREPAAVHQAVMDAIIEVFRKDDRTGLEYHFSRKDQQAPEHRARVAAALERFDKKSAARRQMEEGQPAQAPFKSSYRSASPVRKPLPGESKPQPGGPEPDLSTTRAATLETPSGFFSSLRFIGQVKAMYLVCESDDELVLIDQHAAAERVAFERLREQYHARSILKQALLFPETLELNFRDAKTLESNLERVQEFGFEIETFGERAFILKAVPSVLVDANYSQLILDLLEEISSIGRTVPLEQKLDDIFAVMSCHAVIRGPNILSREQVQALFADLDSIEYPSHCPHGRNAVFRLTVKELEKMFGRHG